MAEDALFETSFEEPFYNAGDDELTVPRGWTPLWDQAMVRPEFALKSTELGHTEVLTGKQAANFFTVHAKHDAVLTRQFAVTPGDLLRLEVWAMIVEDGSGYGVQLGCDPEHKSAEWKGDYVQWSELWSSYREKDEGYDKRTWYRLSLDVTAKSDQIVVFLRGWNDWAGPHAASHWDDFSLVRIAEGPPQEVGDITEDLQWCINTAREIAARLEAIREALEALDSSLEEIAARL